MMQMTNQQLISINVMMISLSTTRQSKRSLHRSLNSQSASGVHFAAVRVFWPFKGEKNTLSLFLSPNYPFDKKQMQNLNDNNGRSNENFIC